MSFSYGQVPFDPPVLDHSGHCMLSLPTCGTHTSFPPLSSHLTECYCLLDHSQTVCSIELYFKHRRHDSGHDCGKSTVTEVSSFTPGNLQHLLPTKSCLKGLRPYPTQKYTYIELYRKPACIPCPSTSHWCYITKAASVKHTSNFVCDECAGKSLLPGTLYVNMYYDTNKSLHYHVLWVCDKCDGCSCIHIHP